MAHFPRWIEHSTVDSAAMCIGYVEWVRKEHKKGRDPVLLPEIRHYPYDLLIGVEVKSASGIDLPWLPCATVNCERCQMGRSGYKFRWYSKMWEKAYMKLRREGSWAPGGQFNSPLY